MRRDTWFKCDPTAFLGEILSLEDQQQALMLIIVTMRSYEIGGPVAENRELYEAARLGHDAGRRVVNQLIELGKLSRLDWHLFSSLYELELRGVGRLPLPRALRARVLEKFGHVCVYCAATENIEIDHVLPVSRGGTDDFENLVPACGPCNRSKGAKLIEEWRRGMV